MTNTKSNVLGKMLLKYLHKMFARLLWIDRGEIKDNDLNRINNDWFDARRIVGYIISDFILEGCKNKTCYDIAYYYLPYLSSISLEEFKKMKAYFIWIEKYGRKNIAINKQDSNYLDSCEEIEQNKINCKCIFHEKLPKNIRTYIVNAKKNNYIDIIRRKAYWNCIAENNHDDINNWKKAEEIVKAIYEPLEKADSLTRRQTIRIVRLIDSNHIITNMFEYCIRCHLFKTQGMTRSSSLDGNELIYCTKTGELLTF